MEPAPKFVLPSPNFDKNPTTTNVSRPHYLTPSGMTLLSREKQPPPMYGPRGATLPPIHLKAHQTQNLVEVERVYCEPCEMEFQTQQDYRRHKNQHESCPVEGCKFRGHYSVMDGHVMALHSSGLFEKVKSVSTPEEIAAWRDERRKKYPTTENVKLRQKAQEERMKRGERLEANKNRFGRREDRKRPFENKTEERKPNNNKMKRQKKQNKRKQFKPQQKFEKEEKEQQLTTTETPSSSLSLLAMYESEVEEDNEEKTKTVPNTTEPDNLSDEAPEEVPIERSSNLPKPADKQNVIKTVTKPKFVRKSGLNYSNLYKRKQNTMLEKLLETEIRHERNVLLQCVRFVVDNNFFDIGKITATK